MQKRYSIFNLREISKIQGIFFNIIFVLESCYRNSRVMLNIFNII